MVAVAETIIERRSGAFEPASLRGRYQDALRELVEAKRKGLVTTPRAIADPPKVINSSRRDYRFVEALSKNNVLAEAIAEAKREARAHGLTDEEIDAELDEWWAERRA